VARNHGQRAADAFAQRIDPKLESLARSIRARINAGVPVDKAVDDAVRQAGLKRILTEDLMKQVEGLLKQMEVPVDTGPAFRVSWLNRTWPGENMVLSDRVNNLTRMTDIKESITTSMRAGESWRDLAMKLSEQDLQKADLAQHARDLVDAARRATNDPETVQAYRNAVHNSMRQIERLAQNGAPTQKLKNAYKELINVSEKTSGEALDDAINRVAREKMRYNADRIARTEMAKAYSQGEYAEALDDDQVIGMGYDLSDRHPKPDICDFHTSVDLFGLGPGRYPLSAMPPYPFHPHCLCTLYKVFSGDASAMNPKAAVKYLQGLPVDKRKFLLGVDGAKDFQHNPSSWSANLTNYGGHKSIADLVRI
jgi:hypothetical protein